jgi:hypothetical protein
MRYIPSLALLLTTLVWLTGCGVVTSTSDVPELTQSAAVGLTARYYDSCAESVIIGQCQLLDIYDNLASTELSGNFKLYVKAIMQHQPADAGVEQMPIKVFVVTKQGSALAEDTFARGMHGVPASTGTPANNVSWRVATLSIKPSKFMVDGDRATLAGTLQIRHTPLYPVLRLQNQESAAKLDSNQNRRVTLNFKFDYDSMGVMRWQAVENGGWLAE